MDRYWLNQPESIIQYIWKQLLFNDHQLQTVDGKSLCILSPGTLNLTDGPDFTNASIVIDGITWHGSVELHINESDWFNHNHHNDPKYNNSILHVYLKDGNQAFCKNGSRPNRLNLLPYLPNQVLPFLFVPTQNHLTCKGLIEDISTDIFMKQLEKASKEYFDQKINQINALYDGALKPSLAWKKALCLSLWEGLGIQHNKEQMLKCGKSILSTLNPKLDFEAFKQESLILIEEMILKGEIRWNYKSVRPNNHPELRVQQALLLSHKILNTDLAYFLKRNPNESWSNLLRTSGLNSQTERMKTLKRIYFLPAIYLLASLLFKSDLQKSAFELWRDHKQSLPENITKYFKNVGLEHKFILKHPGLYPQWKNYCERSQCFSCFVFKSAIES